MTAISSAGAARLRIGASTTDPLPSPASDTFTDVPQLKSVQVPTPVKSTSKENTLDGVTISTVGTPVWNNCTGTFLTNYTQTPHNTILADAAATGRKRNWQIIEPDAGGRVTDFQGEIIRATPSQYQASTDAAPALAHEFEISVTGTPVVTP